MSEIRRIQPPDLVDSHPSGFTQVVSTRGERLIFVSGQVAIDKKEGSSVAAISVHRHAKCSRTSRSHCRRLLPGWRTS